MLAHLAYVIAQVTMTPTSDGAPGASMAQQVINWLGQYALWGSLAAVLVGAILTGLGPSLVNLLYNSASAG